MYIDQSNEGCKFRLTQGSIDKSVEPRWEPCSAASAASATYLDTESELHAMCAQGICWYHNRGNIGGSFGHMQRTDAQEEAA